MTTARGSFLWRRMGSARLLIGSVLLSTLLATALVTALAGFSERALPQAIGSGLARASDTPISIYGEFGSAQVRADDPVVRSAFRRAFGPIPFASARGLWSDSIGFSTGRTVTTLLKAAALSDITEHARLTAGSWPAASARGEPIQVAAPASAAAALHLRVGQVLVLPDRLTGAQVSLRLTGLYAVKDATAPYWGVDLIPPAGVSVQPGFTTYGPFVVAPAAFAGGRLATGGATWLAIPDLRMISSSQLGPLGRRVSAALARLGGSSLGGLQSATELPAALSGAATKLVVARSLLSVSQLQLLLLVMAALAVSARTLAGQREDELAMLTARGSGRWQLVRLALAEALAVSAVAVGAGLVLGDRLDRLLASSGTLRQAGLRLHGIPPAGWWAAGLVLVLCTVIMTWPALRPPTPGAARVRRGRRAAVSGAIRSGGDVALVLLALLAGWQLRHYSVLRRGVGGLGVDPVLTLAPAIALAAATVVPLRLLPVAARAADRLAARTSGLGTAMISWELSRKAVRQSAPVLLVVLAVGAGTLALAQYQSWQQSVADQSAFAAGADVRADLSLPLPLGHSAAFAQARNVRVAVPVSAGLSPQGGGQVIAIDARHAAGTVLLRPDQSALALTTLWRAIVPARSAQAVALPGRPARLEITASLARGAGPALSSAGVTITVQDAAGVGYTVPAGSLPDDGRGHSLVAILSPQRQVIYPLRLLAASVHYTMPLPPGGHPLQAAQDAAQTASFSVSGLAVSAAPGGPFARPFSSGAALRDWSAAAAAPALDDTRAMGARPVVSSVAHGTSNVVTFQPGNGEIQGEGSAPGRIIAQLSLTAPVPLRVIPVIATVAYLRSANAAVGNVLQVDAVDATFAVKIVAVVGSFPTVTGPGGGLIVDLATAQDLVTARQAPPLPVTQWWLATAGAALPRGVPPEATLTSRAGLLASLRSDPLSAVPEQAAAAIAIAAALLAALGFSVSVAASIRDRRSQSALLSALGVDGPAQARMLCAEALSTSVPAALTGLFLGTVLAHLLVPAVTVTPSAQAPVPPVLVVIPLAQALALATAVVVLPALAAAASAARRPDPAAQLRAAEAI